MEMNDLKEIELENKKLRDVIGKLEIQLGNLAKELLLLDKIEKLACVGHFEIGINKNYMKWSNESYRIFGLDPSSNEPNLEKFRELIHPVDADRLFAMFEDTMINGSDLNTEFRIIRSDKKIRHIQISANVIIDLDKTLLFGIFNDITDKKSEELELQKKLDELNTTQEIGNIGSWELNLENNVLKWSDEVYKIFGFKPQEFKPDYNIFLSLIHPEDKILVNEAYTNSIKESRDKYEIEHRIFKKPDNELRIVYEKCKNIRNSDGKIIHSTGMIQDITDRVKVLEDLIESNEFNKQIIKNANEGIVVYDKNLRYLLWNPFMEKLTGLKEDEIIGNHPADKFPFLRETGIINMLESTLEGEATDPFDFKFTLPNGKTGWAIDQTSALYNSKGEIIGGISIINNITTRKNYEIELYKRSLVLNQIRDFVTFTDMDGIITYVNDAKIRAIGYSREEIVGKNVEEIGAITFEGISWEFILRMTKMNGSWRGEIVNKMPHGNETIFDCRTQLVYDTIGEPIGICEISTDITGRRMAEDALGESEEKYRTIFETAASLIFSTDKEGIVIDCNKRIEEVLGYKKHEIIGFKIDKFIFHDDLNYAYENIEKVFENGYTKNKEFRMVRCDGRIIDVLVNSSALSNYLNEPESTICLVDDITGFRSITREIEEQRERLRELSQHIEKVREEEKSRIAYLIHDEIGQELTILKLNIKLLADEIEAKSKPVQEYINQINYTIDSTINNVRTISSELRPSILDHLGIVPAIQWQAEEFTKKSKISCYFYNNPDIIELDNFRSTILFRILQEILSNIIRHSGASKVLVELEICDGCVIMRIDDNGIGIAIQKANDPKSFGLMAIRERVKAINGEFFIEGVADKGTKVLVKAPIQEGSN
jgi:PAS domain S-box-containing protein